MLYATVGDHVPYSQTDDMYTALKTKWLTGVEFDKWVMNYAYGSGYEHAFHCWHQSNNDPLNTDGGECVSEEVINFIMAH